MGIADAPRDRLDFSPFYEFYLAGAANKIAAALVLGFGFLALHGWAAGLKIFGDWSWFLALLISVGMFCLYVATATLRNMISMIALRWPGEKKNLLADLRRILSDRNFILAGALIGVLNCIVGLSLGLPYAGGPAAATILIGYFVAGFIAGMAVLGIYGVCVTIARFFQQPGRAFDFTAPDGCGGTLFIGQALVVFSSVTLIAGVMISIYIVKTDWSGSTTAWVISLKYGWIVLPYVLSLIVLIVPAIPLHNELLRFKEEQEASLKERLTDIRTSLEDRKKSDAALRKDLRDDYEFETNVRRDVHKMRTWPFGLSASVTYLVVFAGNTIASKVTVPANLATWFRSLFS